MKISKQTILLLGALVVLAVGSNLDAAGLKPDRGKGRGTRGKGGSQKKDFQKSAKNAVKALTARIKSDFNLQKGSGPRKFLAAVEGGDVTGFSLLNPLNFTNVKNSANFNAIKTTAGEINTEITQFKDDIKASNTSDNRFIEIEKSASPGGTLYQKYAKFLKDFKTASQPPRKNVDKAARVTHYQTEYRKQLNDAAHTVPAAAKGTDKDLNKAAKTLCDTAQKAYDNVKNAIDGINGIKTTDIDDQGDITDTKHKQIDGLLIDLATAVTDAEEANAAALKGKPATDDGGKIDISKVASIDLANVAKVDQKTLTDAEWDTQLLKIQHNGAPIFVGNKDDFGVAFDPKDVLGDKPGKDAAQNKTQADALVALLNKAKSFTSADDDGLTACIDAIEARNIA